MANNFKNWIDTPVAETNVLSQANFASDTQRANGFKAGDPASAIRVNTGLRQANLVAASLMEAIQVAGVDISSLTHLSAISDVQAKITAGLNTIAKNGLNATTLNGLLSGSNGISTYLHGTGDKVVINLAIPETGPISLTNNNVPRPAILINVEQGGPPYSGGICCSREVGGETTYVGPAGIMIDDGAYVLSINNTNDSFIAYTDIHGMPLGDALIGGGPKGNVKTINGQNIYGSGNIDTTPTLKTVNSTSLTGDGNIYLKEFGVTDGNELNFKASASISDLYVGYATMSETGAKQKEYTISNYKFLKGTGSTSEFADLYCAKLYTSSDERLKENIESYEPTTSVLDLSIKEFNYKDSKVKSVGVIAQEVQKLFPDAVSADKKSGYLSVDDRSLMYMLMAEVKKLRDRVNELEGR